jgi:hypothetical protein
MDQTPLVMDDIEAGAAFIEQLNHYAPVKAAWWLRNTEDSERYLYVAIEGLTVKNSDLAYSEVLRITKNIKDHFIDPFRVRLVSTNNPAAKAVIDNYRRFPGNVRPRFNDTVLGGMPVDEIYIYPQLLARP